MHIDGDTIKFSSGRAAYANNGIVGLSPELEVLEGYDGGIDWPVSDYDEPGPETLTASDMSELADYMIEQWTKFKASLKSE